MNAILWTPTAQQVADALLARFARTHAPSEIRDYPSLHRWSIEHRGDFWTAVWRFADVVGELGDAADDPTLAYVAGAHMTEATWFPGASLNFAENLLRHAEIASNSAFAESPALLFRSEGGESRRVSRRGLLEQSQAFAHHLLKSGVQPGDRVAAVVPNVPEAVIAMLGTTAVGAAWASCSPDFGDDAICDRFGQIEPRVLLAASQSSYNGKAHDVASRVRGLLHRLPSVEQFIVLGDETPLKGSEIRFREIVSRPPTSMLFPRFPFSHPVYILFSSGTTGVPKCIVHGAGGTLLQHLKEHQLHSDLRPGDRLFFHTTTGWMMWNWLASVLASRATAVLFDGSPFHPDPEVLFRLAEAEGVTHFGAGAKYYASLEKCGAAPAERFGLASLRCLLSTGSPLLPENFDYLATKIRPGMPIASISGGTDIVSCFVLGCPTLPVRRGEIQAKGLGMDVHVFDSNGKPAVGEAGELVCTSPFPSMPTGFWNDPQKEKYLAAYFANYPNIWRHGDYGIETAEGGYVILGRSDATLNPGGVRIGTAELYRQVETFPEIVEALAVPLRRHGDEEVILFVRMKPETSLTEELVAALQRRLRERCSPRHVPARILQVPDLPRTISGKLSEIVVRNVINAMPVTNAEALANPESLEFFREVMQRSRIA
ncbi:MAG: acetoacetate--CoA ligase [Gemmataceae bacterium]|nr:acetoacetate--CoA ligase [Gemmataceae bacterium]